MERFRQCRFILAFFALFLALVVSASPLGTTYQARIIKPDGQALESASVNFKFTILDPVGTCILYAETFSAISMANSSGIISFTLGSGVKNYPASATTFAQVFNNSTASLSCDTGGPANYSPAATDIRKIVMQFNDGTGWQTLPAMAINAVPYAIYSNDSLRLGGVSAADYVQYSTIPTCTASEALRYNGSGFNCVTVTSSGGGGSGTVTSSDITTALGYTPANQTAMATSFTTVSNSLTTVGTSFTTVTSTVTSLGNSVTALTSTVSGLSSSMAAITSSQWVTSGTTIFYSSGNVGLRTTTPVTALDVSGGVRIGAESTTCVPALAGTLRYNASNIEYCNGSSWQAFGVSGAGITNLNGSTSATQSFAVGVGGTAPSFVTANGVHTLNIPLASAGSVTAGLLSNADYASFSNKITSSAASIAQVLGYIPADNAASGTYVQKANNLSDLTNIVTARSNLGLGTFATASTIDLGGASTTGTLAIARLPSFTGDATIAAASNTIILANSGVTAGTYTKVTVDTKGRVTSGAQITSGDVTTALGYTPASATAATQWITSGSNIYYDNGSVGIGTTAPQEKFHVSGTLLVTGEWGSGSNLAVSGAGTRMFFYPKKAAFRAGYAGNDEWDDSKIGEASVAMGDGSAALAYGAIALGTGTYASGTNSVAMGKYSQATGDRATAFGESQAIGDLSTSFDSSYAAGFYSVAMGSSSANADRSISIGQNSNANGFGSIAIGHSVNANSYYGVAVGSYNIGNGSGTAWVATDPIFEIGNSQNGSPRTNAMTVLKNGNVGITVSAPTARLHLPSGTTALAPLKFTSGTLLSSPQSGTMEYDGTNFYLTDSTNTRRTIATGSSAETIDNASSINSTGNIVMTPNNGSNSVVVSSTVASTSSNTGALVVKGGLGVTGNINAGGNLQGVSVTATSGMISPYIAGSVVSGGSLTLDSTTHANKGNILLAPNGGNVGIGVSATAAAKLHIVNPTVAVSDTYSFRIDGLDGVNGAEPIFKMGFCQDSMGGYAATCFNSSDTAAGVGSEYVFKGNNSSQDIHFANGSIGIGSVPGSPFDIWSAASFQARIGHVSNNTYDGAAIMMIRERGTLASATAVLNNDTIGGMYFRAYDGANFGTTNAHIEVSASENQTATNKGSVMTFATTQNGQAARQEIMRIHSNGFVGIGNTTPNALLQVGPSGSQNTNYNIYVASYKNNAGQGQYVGNWASSDYWALGPATNTTDKTLRLGIASDRTGTWSGTQDLNLVVGGNLNVSGTMRSSDDLIPANAHILMDACPAGWTDTGAASTGGPGAVTCNGLTCRMCQTPAATLVPPSVNMLMESCPTGWTLAAHVIGPSSSGYSLGNVSIPLITCRSPSNSSAMPKGSRVLSVSCPAAWTDLAPTGTGQFIANCPTASCRVCETPSGIANTRLVYGGTASGTQNGPNAVVVGGRGGPTSGSGGQAILRGGFADNGSGGAVLIQGGAASSTAGTAFNGGSVSIIGGEGISGGDGGAVTVQAGYNPVSGTYSRLTLNSGGGFVGVNTNNPEGRFEVHGLSFVGNAIATNVSQFASGGIRLSYNNGSEYSDAITFAHIGNNGPGTAIGFRKSNYDSFIDFYTNSNSNVVEGGMAHAATISNLGYLGVGTSVPAKVLHIQKDQNSDTAILVKNATTGTTAMSAVDLESDTNGIQLVSYGSGMTGNWGGSTIPKANSAVLRTYSTLPVTNMGIGTGSVAPLHLFTNDVPRLTIATTGYVGIGTSSPTTSLHVVGTTGALLKLQGTSAQGNNWIVFNNNGTDLGYVGFGSSGNKGLNLINYQSDKLSLGTSGTEQVYILPSGSVGIGTSAPPGQMANTAVNLGDAGTIAATAGNGIAPGGLNWQATAGGYAANLFNSGTQTNASGLQVYTASTDTGAYIINARSNGTSRFVVRADGNVGINNSAPSYTLDVNGSARATGSIAAWSDIRAKKNIKVIPDSLNKILQLRGVTFDWRSEEFPDKKFKTTRDIGVIAQEVEKVFPEAVQTAPDSYKSVGYSQLVAPLIEAVKELYYKITGVEREVASLKAENAELKQRVERLEKMMIEQQKSK